MARPEEDGHGAAISHRCVLGRNGLFAYRHSTGKSCPWLSALVMDLLTRVMIQGTSDEHISIGESLLTMASTSFITATSQNIPHLAGAVLVTTPQAVATSDVRKEINFCAKTRIPVLGVIENMSGYTCPCCGEVSNLFSRGGGEIMATEMGVPFLGRVPIDIKFGQLVESQKIEGDISSDVDDEMHDVEDQSATQQSQAEEDNRLLVDKYKDCWSLPIFEEFTKNLLEKVEGSASQA